MSPGEREARSHEICHQIILWSEYDCAHTIMLYAPTADEVDVLHVAHDMMARGMRMCFPSIDWENRTMRAVAVDALGDSVLVARKFGVREPVGGVEIARDEIDLVLVPGVAFSEDGRRLGRGAGFYDRFLDGLGAVKLGVCFREQIVESLQAEPHDVPMDALVTDGRDMILVTVG